MGDYGSAVSGAVRVADCARLARRLPPVPLILLLCAIPVWPARAAPGEPAALRLNLEQCIEAALLHNASIHVAREQAEAAAARKRIAFAEYLPKLSLTAQYTHLDEVRSTTIEADRQVRDVSLNAAAWWAIAESAGTAAANAAYDNRAVDPMQTFNTARAQAAAAFPRVQTEPILGQNVVEAQVLLTQPIFTGGKIRYANKMAALDQRIRSLGIRVSEDDVILDVTNAYLGAVTSRLIGDELNDLLVRLGAVRDSTLGLLDVGSEKASTRDLAQTDIAVAATRQDLSESRRAEEVALAALKRAMGLDEDEPLMLVQQSAPLEDAGLSLSDCETLALQHRRELSQAGLARELRQHGVSRAKAAFAPDIAAFGGVRYLDDNESFPNPNDDEEWFAGVAMELPIFTGLSRFAKIREARSNVRQAAWVETEVRRGIVLQVREAYHSLRAAESKLTSAEEMVEAATRLRTITSAARTQHIGSDYRRMLLLSDEPEVMEFKVMPDVPEVVDAEVAQTQSRIRRSSAAFELAAARARLARAIGVRSLEEAGQ